MESIKDVLFRNPLYLEDIPEVNEVSEFYLPYSTGIEIECAKSNNFELENFTSINDIINVNIDGFEQRFRLPSGFIGFKCLFNITQQLNVNSIPNEGSGIHYHIDFTGCFDGITKEFLAANQDWVFKEFDRWNYKGTYNKKTMLIDVRGWVNFQRYFKTMEVRIGEMSFDYNLILKRILHCQYVAKVLKENIELFKQGEPMINSSIKYGNIDKTISNRKILL